MAEGENRDNINKDELVSLIASAVAPLVKSQSDATSELLGTMNEIKLAQQLINERLTRVAALSDSHEHILRGNGRVGILTRIESIEEHTRKHEDLLQELTDALRGADDKPGLIGRVSQLEVKAEGLAKPMWIILSALLGTGVTLIITNLIK